jgi:hypothetical protein
MADGHLAVRGGRAIDGGIAQRRRLRPSLRTDDPRVLPLLELLALLE